MKGMKKKLLIPTLTLIVLSTVPTNNVAKSGDIDVYVDSKKLEFEVAPIIRNGTTYVPMRDIFEELDAEIQWDGKTQTITALKDNIEMKLKIGANAIIVNGVKDRLSNPPILYKKKTVVPLRAISEGYGLDTKWINETRDVRIYSETIGINNGGKEIQLGMSTKDLEKLMGKPSRIDSERKKETWYIYNNTEKTYKDYIMVGIKDHKVIGFKTNSKRWKVTDEIAPGKKYKGKDYYDNLNKVYKKNNKYVEVLPFLEEGIIDGVSVYEIDKDYRYRNVNTKINDKKTFTYYRPIVDEKYTDKQIEGLEQQIFEMTNVLRVRKGLKPLKMNKNLDIIAKNHSKSMGTNDFFSHDGEGQKFEDRLESFIDRYNWSSMGENIIFGMHDSLEYVNLWNNSKGHRVNLLSSKFDKLGVGGFYNQSKTHIYFTQNFAK